MSNIEADKVTIGDDHYKNQKPLYAVKYDSCFPAQFHSMWNIF